MFTTTRDKAVVEKGRFLGKWMWPIIGILIVLATYIVFDLTHTFYKVYSVGMRYYYEGRYSQALPYLREAYRMSPKDKNIGEKLVSTYSNLGRESEGARLLEEMNARFSADPKTMEALGDMAFSTKAYPLAQKYYRQILSLKDSANIRRKYIKILIAEEKYPEAVNQMDILLTKAPSDLELRFEHAQIVSRLGDHERAARELQSLLDQNYNRKETLIMYADELRQLGRNEEAIKIYHEVNQANQQPQENPHSSNQPPLNTNNR